MTPIYMGIGVGTLMFWQFSNSTRKANHCSARTTVINGDNIKKLRFYSQLLVDALRYGYNPTHSELLPLIPLKYLAMC